MALLSTFATAVDLIRASHARRLGRDPSEQQSSDVVFSSLTDELCELEDHLIALRASLAAAEREALNRVALVRHMSDLILLGGVSRSLHAIHQHLMSLYPGVSENLVEDARRLHTACGELIEHDDGLAAKIVAFIEDCTDFVAEIRQILRRKWTVD